MENLTKIQHTQWLERKLQNMATIIQVPGHMSSHVREISLQLSLEVARETIVPVSKCLVREDTKCEKINRKVRNHLSEKLHEAPWGRGPLHQDQVPIKLSQPWVKEEYQ